MPGHVIEATGVGSLPELGERLLTEDKVHLAVFRDAVPDEFFDRVSSFGATESEKLEVMNEMIPGFTVLQGVVKSWWEANGYKDTELDNPVQYAGVNVNKNHTSHIDSPQIIRSDSLHYLFGGMTLSVGNGLRPDSYADFAVKKALQPLMQPGTREFDEDAYYKLGFQARGTRWFPARTKQYKGDIVMFAQHPAPAIHRVKAHNDRSAKLIDFPITPVFPDIQRNYGRPQAQ